MYLRVRSGTCKEKMKKIDGDYDGNAKCDNRFLININVFRSSGPIRFVVNGDDDVAGVIRTALKVYAREGRLPVLGSDINTFFLYPANAELQALKAWEEIGLYGVRNFVLCKNQGKLVRSEARSQLLNRKARGWRAWLQKSFSLRIQSH